MGQKCEEFEKLENTLQSIDGTLKRIEEIILSKTIIVLESANVSNAESISDGVMKAVESAIHGTGE